MTGAYLDDPSCPNKHPDDLEHEGGGGGVLLCEEGEESSSCDEDDLNPRSEAQLNHQLNDGSSPICSNISQNSTANVINGLSAPPASLDQHNKLYQNSNLANTAGFNQQINCHFGNEAFGASSNLSLMESGKSDMTANLTSADYCSSHNQVTSPVQSLSHLSALEKLHLEHVNNSLQANSNHMNTQHHLNIICPQSQMDFVNKEQILPKIEEEAYQGEKERFILQQLSEQQASFNCHQYGYQFST